ncbi:hypothetical protein SCNRRL3882_3584 [Streptomyces chartreusis NRRL 3882]|uniref:Uncharacterized protein n=2 Tax=Streptomyces TaxID=1883 RepID=A0A2N9B9T0_STRCX|nr:hypothetical protein SCNRRL3882_3584 [Streptomyces chartreusis NRRL 3882]
MKVYWIEVRRSPLVWCLPLLLLVEFASVFGRSQWWIGVWPQASAAAQIPAIFFAPAFSAAAAWSVNRSLRTGMLEQRRNSAQPLWKLDLIHFLATLTHGIAVYTIGIVAAALVTFPDAGRGFLWPSYLLLGAATITACAAVGHIVGRLTNSPFAAPVICGLATFVGLGSLGKSLGLFVLSGSPAYEVPSKALAPRIVLAAVLVAIAVLAPSLFKPTTLWSPKGDQRLVIGMGFVGAVITTMVLISMSGPIQAPRSASVDPLCSQGAPKVCVWPEDKKYLNELAAMAQRLDEIPQDWITVPRAMYERGLRKPSEKTANDFEVLEGNFWFVSPNMAGSVMELSLHVQCPEDEAVGLAIRELEAWLEVRANNNQPRRGIYGGPPGVDYNMLSRVAAATEAEQKTWVDNRLRATRKTSCD